MSKKANLEKESETLKQEYKWVLQQEIPSRLENLHKLLMDCIRRFPLRNMARENIVKPEKFLLTVSSNSSTIEGVKCVVTLLGDNICEADIQMRLHKHHGQIYKTGIFPDNPWKLQQLQDAGNHLSAAIELLSQKKGHSFFSKQEVIMLLNDVMNYLTTGRHCLIMPRKKTIQELQCSRNMRTLTPALPSDTAISFYIQSHKLCLAVYHIFTSHGQTKFDVQQGECLVPWLNEALAMFTVAMHMCQQMKDKVSVFSQYTDVFPDSSLILTPTEDQADRNITNGLSSHPPSSSSLISHPPSSSTITPQQSADHNDTAEEPASAGKKVSFF